MEEMRNEYYILVEHEGKRPHRRVVCRWGDNIRIGLWEIRWEGVGWMHLTQDRPVVNSCEHGNEPLGSIKGREFLYKLSD
jgi:hypothetical protein